MARTGHPDNFRYAAFGVSHETGDYYCFSFFLSYFLFFFVLLFRRIFKAKVKVA